MTDAAADASGSRAGFAREFAAGARVALPIIVAVVPFGLLFGAVGVQNGLSVWEAVLMSGAIFGGASQMVGIELFGQSISPWLVIFSILAVNFRHVLYSAAFGRLIGGWPAWQKAAAFFFLTDPQYAESERRRAGNGSLSFAWYMGLALPVYLLWVVEAFIGAWFGTLLPNTRALGIDFLLPIYFLGLLLSFRTRPLFLPVAGASAVASMAAYATVGSPWHVSLGALAGIAVAFLWPAGKDASP